MMSLVFNVFGIFLIVTIALVILVWDFLYELFVCLMKDDDLE